MFITEAIREIERKWGRDRYRKREWERVEVTATERFGEEDKERRRASEWMRDRYRNIEVKWAKSRQINCEMIWK